MRTLSCFNQSDDVLLPLLNSALLSEHFDAVINIPEQWVFRRFDSAGRQGDKLHAWSEADTGGWWIYTRAFWTRELPARLAHVTDRPRIILDIEHLPLSDDAYPFLEASCSHLRATIPNIKIGLYNDPLESVGFSDLFDFGVVVCYRSTMKLQVSGVPQHSGEEHWSQWTRRVSNLMRRMVEIDKPFLTLHNLFSYHDGGACMLSTEDLAQLIDRTGCAVAAAGADGLAEACALWAALRDPGQDKRQALLEKVRYTMWQCKKQAHAAGTRGNPKHGVI